MSLIRPASQCPACGRAIRWYDNMPIVSWLVLGGRCRDCQARISPRYLFVEVLTAVVSAALGWSEVIQPTSPLGPDAPPTFVLEVGPYALHMLLVCTLLSAALIELDGLAVPLRLLASVLVVGLAVTIVWPGLQLDEAAGQWALRGVPESVSGLLASLWISLLAWPAWVRCGRGRDVATGASAAYELALVGVFLGLRAAVAVGVVAMALFIAAAMQGRLWPLARRPSWALWLSVATLAWIVGWRTAMPYLPVWIERNEWGLPLAGGALVAFLALVARWTLGPEPTQRASAMS